jgi:LCP family protein required for cell wall assembly
MSRRSAPVDGIDGAPPYRAQRSWGQRLLLGFGVLVSLAAIAAAATAGWAAWKYRSIDRANVALDQLATGAPANYLVVGSDSRANGDPNDPHAKVDHKPLADTIMVMRVDPANRHARVLSLPRDLWVDLAGTGHQGRINEAYAGGGPQRLIDTLKAQLNIPINHYLEVDFKGFQGMVNAVGGVPMWFDRAMRDRNSGLEILHPGCTTLNGDGALSFARARHLQYLENGRYRSDGTGDLGRISRQQLFIRRLIDRAKTKGINNPLALKGLVDAGTSNVTLDKQLAISDLVALGERFSSFDSRSLVSYTLPTSPRTTAVGAQVLDLDSAAAQPILDQFRTTPVASPTTTTSVSGRSGRSLASGADAVWVLNSSGRTGLAISSAGRLEATGWRVAHSGNGAELAHPSEASSQIRYGSGAESTAMQLAAQVADTPRVAADRTLPAHRVVLLLGRNFRRITDAAQPSPPSGSSTSGSSSSVTTTPATPPPPSKVTGIVPDPTPAGRTCS